MWSFDGEIYRRGEQQMWRTRTGWIERQFDGIAYSPEQRVSDEDARAMLEEYGVYRLIRLTQEQSALNTEAQRLFGPRARLGRWHEQAGALERQVGALQVRKTDPEFPVFCPATEA